MLRCQRPRLTRLISERAALMLFSPMRLWHGIYVIHSGPRCWAGRLLFWLFGRL